MTVAHSKKSYEITLHGVVVTIEPCDGEWDAFFTTAPGNLERIINPQPHCGYRTSDAAESAARNFVEENQWQDVEVSDGVTLQVRRLWNGKWQCRTERTVLGLKERRYESRDYFIRGSAIDHAGERRKDVRPGKLY